MAADPLLLKPPGFAGLAKRISAWTTRGLLTVIVLVAGLGFGRQVLKWWAADATPPGTAAVGLATDGLGDPSQLHTLQFGDNSWSLQRRSISGEKDKAIEQLRAACREVLQTVSPPAKAGEGPRATAAGEREFLAFLSNSTPIEEKAGKWRLYELNTALPMAVGVARTECGPKGTVPFSLTRKLGQSPNLAQMGYRVVIWGLAVPAGPGGWTLCTFQPGAQSGGERSGSTDVPLPPGGHRTLSIRSAGGGGIVAFGGPDRPAQWRRFYNDWFARQGWQAAATWQPTGAAWYAKFAEPEGGDSIDIRFGPDGRGGLSGLLMVTARESK